MPRERSEHLNHEQRQLSRKTANGLGLTNVYSPKHCKPIVDIIFIHGLGGQSHFTWSYKKDLKLFWPGWLHQEPGLDEVRISTYGYDSTIWPAFTKNFSCIDDFAQELLARVKVAANELNGETPFGEIPIIIVAHSLGGLVAEQACNNGIKDFKYQPLIHSTVAMIFLATPHHGSELADLVDNTIQKMSLGFFSKLYLAELRSDSSVLSEINRGFQENLPGIAIISFCETQGIPFTKLMVVKKDSATLGYPGEMIIPLNTNHRMICKYRNRHDGNYLAFLCVLRKMIVDATRRPIRGRHQNSSTLLALENDIYHNQGVFTSFQAWVPGSCEWIFSDTTFLSWMHAQERGPRWLWLCGPPGSGKSVLSAFIAQQLSMRVRGTICFFSAPLASGGSLTLDVLLRSLRDQLSAQLPLFRQIPTPLTQLRIGFDCSSWSIFWRILIESLLSIEQRETTYLIIDDIDKFDDPGSFLTALEEHSIINLPLRVLVASEISHPGRSSNFFNEELGPQILDLKLLEGVKKDLQLVVAERVQSLRGLDDLKSDITAHILNNSGGNFLCADLLYREIKNCRRREQLHSIFNKSAQGVTSYYQLMERELESRWTTDDRDDAQVLMPWILHSFIPLTIEQLHYGLKYLGVEFIDLQLTITRVCGRFLTVNNKSQVRLIHPTAQRFILDQRSFLNVDSKAAHRSILVSCLTCLDSFAAAGSRRQEEFGSFREYAMKFWFRHLEKCELDKEESILGLVVAFFQGQGILSWIFLVSRSQVLQYMIAAALSINRFIGQLRSDIIIPGQITFLERCSTDLCILVERFSKPLLSNPEVIFELVPLFCPSKSFIKPLARSSNVSLSGFPFREWDNYLAAFTIDHGCRGMGITCAENKFAIATSTQEGLVLVYNSPKRSLNSELVHRERVMAIQFSRSGAELATYGPTTTTLWDLSTKQPSQTFSNPPNTNLLAFTFAQDDSAIYVFSDDYILRIMTLDGSAHNWESVDLGARREPANSWINPSCASFDHQTRFLAVGFLSDPIEIWDLLSFVCVKRFADFSCPQSDVTQLSWCPQPDRMIVRQRDGCLTILDLFRHEPIATCTDMVSMMSCNDTSEFLVTGDMAGTVKVRRISDLRLLYHVRGPESSIDALSIAPGSGKIYGIQSSKCIVWEPSLLAKTASDEQSQDPAFSSRHPSQDHNLNQNDSFVTALATCERSSAYCAGYMNGQIKVILVNGTELPLDLRIKVRIEHILWSPDEQYVALVDLGARLFIVSVDHQGRKYNQMASFQLQSRIEQILFQRTSRALLAVTEDDILTWELGTHHMNASHHSLGRHSRWINHPIKDDLVLGIGPDDIQICQWHDHRTISSISLNNSISDLTFGLELLDYVKTEPSRVTLHPSLASCQVKRVLPSPDKSMLLLVTTRQTRESISGSQFLQIPLTELDATLARSHGVICPVPLIESLSDIIAMPLGFLDWNGGEDVKGQVTGNRLIFLNKENWICSTRVDSSNEKHAVQRHIFLPDDWLAAEDVELIQVHSNRIYIPRSEHVAIIRNALDVWY